MKKINTVFFNDSITLKRLKEVVEQKHTVSKSGINFEITIGNATLFHLRYSTHPFHKLMFWSAFNRLVNI